MDFSGYIARRYMRSRRNSRFLSRGSVTAIIGIIIGVAVLNITLAVMNGFRSEMQRSLVENMPMISVRTSDAEGFQNLGQVLDTIGADADVIGAAPFVRQEVVLTASRVLGPPKSRGVLVWGIEPDLVDDVLPLSKSLSPNPVVIAGLRNNDSPRVILGASLANELYVAIGDTIVLTAAKGGTNLQNMEAESRKFVVTGYFETGAYDIESSFVYVGIDVAREFFGYSQNGASTIGIKVTDMMAAGTVATRIQETLGYGFYATDWMTLNSTLFEWIKNEKIIMALLLGMIILIAGFNIVGILTMMVGERRREIGILLAMGAKRRDVMGIFLINGLWLGGIGSLIGGAIGLLAIFLLHTFGLKLPGDVYMLDSVPVLLKWTDFTFVWVTTLAMSLLAAVWPSWEASNFNPMEIIRYN